MNWALLVRVSGCLLVVSVTNCLGKEESKREKASELLSRENIEKINAKKGKNSFFRSKGDATPEEKIANDLFKKAKTFTCTEKCSPFSKEYEESLAKMVQLYTEAAEEVDNDVDAFLEIAKDIFSKCTKSKEVNEDLVKTAYIKACKISNNTDINQLELDPPKIFPNLRTENIKKGGVGFRAGAGETIWENLPKVPSRAQAPEDTIDYFREDENLHTSHKQFHAIHGGMPRDKEHFYYFHRLYLYRYFDERDSEGLPPVQPFSAALRNEEFNSYYSLTPQTDPSGFLSEQHSSNTPTCRITQATNGVLARLEARCNSKLAERNDNFDAFFEECIDYHNNGHNLISADCIVDKSKVGLIGNTPVAGRDPIFYRWHYEVDNKYETFLKNQPAYTREQILPPGGLVVTSVELQSRCSSPNQVETFWESEGSKYQLNHMPFHFNIRLRNGNGSSNKVIVRIYLVNEKFLSNNKFYFELDRFTHTLSGANEETIVRADNQSSLIWGSRDDCGWPPSLVLPRGKSQQAVKYRLVVFVHDLPDQSVNEGDIASLLCGPRGGVLDPRPNGWPMQRDWQGINFLDVINNQDEAFGQISTTVEIFNRGLNPTGCGDAQFTNNGQTTPAPSASANDSTSSESASTESPLRSDAVTSTQSPDAGLSSETSLESSSKSASTSSDSETSTESSSESASTSSDSETSTESSFESASTSSESETSTVASSTTSSFPDAVTDSTTSTEVTLTTLLTESEFTSTTADSNKESSTSVPDSVTNPEASTDAPSTTQITTLSTESESPAPYGSETTVPVVPYGSETTVPAVPYGSETTVPVVPYGSETTAHAVPYESETTVPVVPYGSETTVPLVPYGSETTVPVVPYGSKSDDKPRGYGNVPKGYSR
ncbi:hemocyanin D chain isoform X1 [Eurytemora carolleeae]|uniref:hemocyanin D chain isoform X1 n=1 Tax=Eurytemora carolleeae TaxID=1294199 RepID=UPI000C7695EA|nr:hemocyanin D chain isoform X1 [Eurytemora carolleeae]|eukprot:XP_023328226.1 hemocyanin D chain-like isoform X1 [Eurytemora affinis]